MGMGNRAVGTKTRFPKGPWQSCRGLSLGLQKIVVVIILASTCPVFYTAIPVSLFLVVVHVSTLGLVTSCVLPSFEGSAQKYAHKSLFFF